VMADLKRVAETRLGMEFWQALLNVSTVELMSGISRNGVAKKKQGSALSEFDMYFHFAAQKWPQTFTTRPLLWANGPANNRLYWPQPDDKGNLHTDSHVLRYGSTSSYRAVRGWDVPKVLPQILEADKLMGYDFVGYHSYANRRYYEMDSNDVNSNSVCDDPIKGRLNENSTRTCSWKGFKHFEIDPNMSREELLLVKQKRKEDWFKGCLCYLFNRKSS
jgi:hypothetical protein